MTLLTRIREHVALITLLAVWSAIILNTFTHMRLGQIENGQVMFYVLTVVAVSVFLSLIPAIAIVSGWYTGNRTSAALLGVFLLPALLFLGYIAVSRQNMVWIRIPETILYITILSGISGLAGYCAARRMQQFLAVAIVLAGFWVFLLTGGIR